MIDATYAVNCLKQGFQRYIRYNKINATIDCGDNYVSFYVKGVNGKQYLARGSNHHLKMQHLADKDEPWNGDNISVVFIIPSSPQDTRIRGRVRQNNYGGIKPFSVTTYQYDNTILNESDLRQIFYAITVFLNGKGYTDPFAKTPKAAKVIPRNANIKPYKEPSPARNISVDKDGNYVSANAWGADYVSENKQYNTNRSMNKKLIRLTESDLHRIVKESVNKALNKSNSVFYDDRPSKSTKVDRSNSSNKRTMSPDEIEKIHNIVSEVSVAPNGFKHRFDPNKRDGDFPLEQPEWTKDPRWQGWNGEDPEWIMKQQEKYPYGGESKQSVRVSEAQLHQIVKESVEQALSEGFFDKFRRTANAKDAYKGLDGDYSYSKDNDRFYYHDKYGNKHDTGIGYGKGNVGVNWNPFKFWNSGDRQVTQNDANYAKRRLQRFNDSTFGGRADIDYKGKRAYDNEQERKRQEAWHEQQRREEEEANRRRAEYEAEKRATARQAERSAYEDYVNKQQWMR